MGVLGLLWRPQELAALIKLKRKIGKWKARAAKQEKDADWMFCFDMLEKVSRSFAVVIEQLGDELRNAVCVFYLVLRGLDTVGRRRNTQNGANSPIPRPTPRKPRTSTQPARLEDLMPSTPPVPLPSSPMLLICVRHISRHLPALAAGPWVTPVPCAQRTTWRSTWRPRRASSSTSTTPSLVTASPCPVRFPSILTPVTLHATV